MSGTNLREVHPDSSFDAHTSPPFEAALQTVDLMLLANRRFAALVEVRAVLSGLRADGPELPNEQLARIMAVAGEVHHLNRRLPEATDQFLRARELLFESGSAASPEAGKVSSRLGEIYSEQHDTAQALVSFKQATEILDAAQPDAALESARAYFLYSRELWLAGQWDLAAMAHETALARIDSISPLDSDRFVAMLHDLGELLQRDGSYPRAIDFFLNAKNHMEREPGVHRRYTDVVVALARAHAAQANYEGALETLRELFDGLLLQRPDQYYADMLYVYREQARIMALTSARDEALVMQRGLRESALSVVTEDPELLVRVQTDIAETLILDERLFAALEEADKAVDSAQRWMYAIPPETVIQAYCTRAQIKTRLGYGFQAAADVQRAIEIAEINNLSHSTGVRLQIFLGRALLTAGEKAAASAAVAKAEELLGDTRPSFSSNWLAYNTLKAQVLAHGAESREPDHHDTLMARSILRMVTRCYLEIGRGSFPVEAAVPALGYVRLTLLPGAKPRPELTEDTLDDLGDKLDKLRVLISDRQGREVSAEMIELFTLRAALAERRGDRPLAAGIRRRIETCKKQLVARRTERELGFFRSDDELPA